MNDCLVPIRSHPVTCESLQMTDGHFSITTASALLRAACRDNHGVILVIRRPHTPPRRQYGTVVGPGWLPYCCCFAIGTKDYGSPSVVTLRSRTWEAD